MWYPCAICKEGSIQTNKGPEANHCDKCGMDEPSGICNFKHRVCLKCLLEYVKPQEIYNGR